jgi:AraC-like DNA-binding protein
MPRYVDGRRALCYAISAAAFKKRKSRILAACDRWAAMSLTSSDAIGARKGYEPLPRDLVRALDWLRPRLSEPVHLDELAAAAGVSARTLENHFRTYLGTTPVGWMRRTRLANTRRQLLDGRGAESITAVALANGFSQLGRFAKHYHEVFGERPSQTQARATKGADAERIDDEAAFLAWRALPAAYFVAPKDCRRALDDVERAQEIAPGFGLPKGIMAWCKAQRAAFNFTGAGPSERTEIVRLAENAAALSPNEALTLTVCSGAMALAHRLDAADRLIERAIAMDPWSPMTWVRRAWVSAYLGDGENALREFSVVMHMMPFEPIAHLALIGSGCAHFSAGRYDRAARWTREGVKGHPGSFWAERITAAAAVHCGAREEGRRIVRGLLRKDPDLTIANARDALPFAPAFVDRLADGLRTAGVPLH